MVRIFRPRFEVHRRNQAPPGSPVYFVVRPTTSRESGAALGILHEAKCKLCGVETPRPDSLASTMRWTEDHLRKEHPGRVVIGMNEVPLGEEHWG